MLDRPWYWEKLVLAWYGYVAEDLIIHGRQNNVRRFTSLDSKNWFIVKRFAPRQEVRMLRLLSSKSFDHPANHTAFPVGILFFDRLLIAPQYHGVRDLVWTPDLVVNFSGQLLEAVRFLHDARIVHMDIFIPNIVVAVPSAGRVQFLLIDFELAQWFPSVDAPRMDLWWMAGAIEEEYPPGGINDVDPFAFDVLCCARTIKSVIRNMAVRKQFVEVEWPPFLMALLDEMRAHDQTTRPSIQTCEARFTAGIAAADPISYSRGPARLQNSLLCDKERWGDLTADQVRRQL